jgi:DNA modification methylase
MQPAPARNHDANRLAPDDYPVHDWYRFVLSYPPHLVRTYLSRFNLDARHTVLDPFCGTGTTVVECKKRGIPSVGIEANPVGYLASSVKTDWQIDGVVLMQAAVAIAEAVRAALLKDGFEDDPLFRLPLSQAQTHGLRTLDPVLEKLLLKGSISPLPLHKALLLREQIQQHRDAPYFRHLQLAFAKTVTFSSSNLQFGPEVGVGRLKDDAPVVEPWLAAVRAMADDLAGVRGNTTAAVVHHADARHLSSVLQPQSIDAIVTSPPYPNEKDYTRTTRLEAVMLGFLEDKAALRALKRNLVRSNTRGVYVTDDDDRWVQQFPQIQQLADLIEARRIELGKTSGFERLYARVTRLYFGGMARHLAALQPVLKPGAHLAYVVGDQASYLRVMIRTGTLLAEIAAALGYEVIGIDLFRTRLATATREQLREEVLLLRWPGSR